MWVGSSLQHAISGDPPAGDPERTERDMTIDTDGGTTKGKRLGVARMRRLWGYFALGAGEMRVDKDDLGGCAR
eukprot:1130805-Amorphochlora_amoeboformis.AAC.3